MMHNLKNLYQSLQRKINIFRSTVSYSDSQRNFDILKKIVVVSFFSHSLAMFNFVAHGKRQVNKSIQQGG